MAAKRSRVLAIDPGSGGLNDPTAVLGLEQRLGEPAYVTFVAVLPGLPLQEQAKAVAAIISAVQPHVAPIDSTGLGRAMSDVLVAEHGRLVVPVIITAGQTASYRRPDGKRGWSIPKAVLVADVQVALEQRKLRLADDLPEDQRTLIESQIRGFGVTTSAAGTVSYGNVGADHDDIVSCLALALHASRKILGSPGRISSPAALDRELGLSADHFGEDPLTRLTPTTKATRAYAVFAGDFDSDHEQARTPWGRPLSRPAPPVDRRTRDQVEAAMRNAGGPETAIQAALAEWDERHPES